MPLDNADKYSRMRASQVVVSNVLLKGCFMKTVMAMRTIQGIIQRSAAKLDKEIPGWYKRIDVDKLNLGSDERCICGQLGINLLPNPDKKIPENKRIWPVAFCDELAYSVTRGFFKPIGVTITGGKSNTFEQLWRHQIAKRIRCDERKAVDAMFRC